MCDFLIYRCSLIPLVGASSPKREIASTRKGTFGKLH